MKKIVCVLLVAVMVFAMATCAFAANTASPTGKGSGQLPTGGQKPGANAGGGAPSVGGAAGAKGGASGETSAQTGYNTVVLVGAAVVLTLGAGVCFVNVRKVEG